MSKARNIADLGSNDVLDTTASGIDVTGSVISDGITVDGVSNLNGTVGVNNTSGYASVEVGGSTGAYVDMKAPNSDDFDLRIIHEDNSGSPYNVISAKTGDLFIATGSSATNRVNISNTTGDITVYKDDGATAGFEYDASTANVTVNGDIKLTETGDTTQSLTFQQVGGASFIKPKSGSNDGELYISGGQTATNRMKITTGGNIIMYNNDGSTMGFLFEASSGNIGIGRSSSPARNIHVEDSTSAGIRLDDTGGTAGGSTNTYVEFFSGGTDVGYIGAKTGAGYFGYQNNYGPLIFHTNNSSGTAAHSNLYLYNNKSVFNENGDDVDFRVESNNNSNMIFVDGGNDVVGIGTNDIRTPSKLIVGGSQSFVGSDGNFSGGGNRAFIDIENSATRHMRLGYTSGGSSSSGGIRFYVASSSSATSAQMALTPEGRLAVGGTDAGKSRLNIQGETGYGKGVLTRQNQVYTFVRNFVNTGSANSSIELCTIGYDHANWNSMWFKVEVFNDYYQSGGESAWILDSQAGTARQLYSQNPSGSWSSSTTQINSNLTRRVWTWNGNQYRSYGMRVTFAYDPVDTDPTAGKVRFTTGNYGGY